MPEITDASTTWIVLSEAGFTCKIGCTEAERAFPQRLVVTARAEIRRPPDGKYSLAQSVCWATLSDLIGEILTERDWILVEDLSEVIAARVFQEFPAAVRLKLRIQKFALAHAAWVGVEFERAR